MPMEIKYTNDFTSQIDEILSKWSKKSCNLMISGGSILDYFDCIKMHSINSSEWSIFYCDERCEGIDLNYNKSLKLINNTKAKVYQMNIENNATAAINSYKVSCTHIDLAILGVGEDGHVASIFPGSKILDSEEYFVHVDDSPKPPANRVTATIKFFNECVDELIFLIPPKFGGLKNVTAPCDDILKRLKRNFTVYLDERLKE